MSSSTAETNIKEIASVLVSQREQGQCPVLFLGTRAGGLFGNKYLYETLKKFSLLNFDNLSNADKFKECYYLLSMHFSNSEIHDILVGALGLLWYREEDRLLTGLVKGGFFKVIISTNIDSVLEDAYGFWGMREPNDYRVFIQGLDNIGKVENNKPRNGYILKVFGKLKSLRYNTTGSEFDLKADHSLQKFLESKLMRDVLVVGYDPVWDRSIEHAFLPSAGKVWYVNETAIAQNSYLASVFAQRDIKYLQGYQGSYSSFFRTLNDLIGERVSQEDVATMPFLLLSQSSSRLKTKVFISYSHRDKTYLERLLVHLKGYLPTGSEKDILDIREDLGDDIPLGLNWQEEIKKVLMSVKVAVLLVSSDFLASDIIRKYELPFLLEAARKGEVKLLPIILDSFASSFNDREPLRQYQEVNNVSDPLKWMNPYEQEVMWAKLAKQVYDILSS